MPSTTAAEAKARLRARLTEQLSALPPEERRAEDRALLSAFLRLSQVDAADTVFLFLGMDREPDTALLLPQLLRRGKRLALPRCLPGRGMEARLYCPDLPLVRHRYGMLEPSEDCPPVPAGEIDLALVPALCYDRRGFRLGFGGGYYDRWLARFGGFSVGLCRDRLLQDRLPTEDHDRPVDLVLTAGARFPAK